MLSTTLCDKIAVYISLAHTMQQTKFCSIIIFETSSSCVYFVTKLLRAVKCVSYGKLQLVWLDYFLTGTPVSKKNYAYVYFMKLFWLIHLYS